MRKHAHLQLMSFGRYWRMNFTEDVEESLSMSVLEQSPTQEL